MNIGRNNRYSVDYLNEINHVLTNRIDGNNGRKDGKVTARESYNDLNVTSLFTGLKQGSFEYNRLKSMTDNIPQALQKYAGDDGIFQAQEYADFINGDEWKGVLDTYHSSSNFAQTEMDWIDNSKGMYADGNVTKGEVKVGIMNSMANIDPNYDTSEIESVIDKYAGDDGTFTVEEYTALKNDDKYSKFLNQYNASPFSFD